MHVMHATNPAPAVYHLLIAVSRFRLHPPPFQGTMSCSKNSVLQSIAFNAITPRAARIQTIAPILNKAIDDFLVGNLKMGVEAFEVEVLRVISDAGLLESRVYDVGKVAIHPENREEEMAVIADIHDLLDRMVEDGFNPKKWVALACTIPEGCEGDRWRAENVKLAEESDGYLAPVRAEELEIATARGSHGTSALRCAKFGAKAVHKQLASGDGMLSKEIICELAPSFRNCLENGVLYDIIPGQLALQVPKLMSTLSRNGNNFNDVFRLQSSLQICSRIHKLSLQAKGDDDWETIAERASKGNGGKTFLPKARMLADFVKNWAGGKDDKLLKHLEQYEKGLDFKRKLSPADMQALSKLQVKFPRYIIAIIKAMLTAPSADQGGYSNTFALGDFSSVSVGGRNQAAAEAAAELMQQAESYLAAYSRMTPGTSSKLLSKLEVRAVMFTHSKKAAQRLSFASLDDIALAFFEEAKKEDEKLPKWSRLSEIKPEKKKSAQVNLKELSIDGNVPDSELEARSFKEGALIKTKGKDDHQYFKIVKIKSNFEGVVLEEIGADGIPIKQPAATDIGRGDLMMKYEAYQVLPRKALTDLPDLCGHAEVLAAVVKGAIVEKMIALQTKSSENDITLVMEPKKALFVDKDFNTGAMKLVAFSTGVVFLPAGKAAQVGCMCIGKSEQLNVNIFLRPSNVFKEPDLFVAKYFMALNVNDARVANCEVQFHDYSVKFNGETIGFKIPMCVNTKKLTKASEIKLLSTTACVVPLEASKRQRKK